MYTHKKHNTQGYYNVYNQPFIKKKIKIRNNLIFILLSCLLLSLLLIKPSDANNTYAYPYPEYRATFQGVPEGQKKGRKPKPVRRSQSIGTYH